AICKAKAQISSVFTKVTTAVKALNAENNFSFDNLKQALANPNATPSAKKTTLLEYWIQFGESKNTHKTREQYSSSLKNFYRFLGCTVESVPDANNPKQKMLVVKGKKAKVAPSFVDETVISQWQASMEEAGLSDSTKSIYLRALRAVMNSLGESNIISKTPKFAIKQGTRRKEDYIPVSDIVKIRDYEGHGRKAADWWLILYLCNGSNLKDLAKLEWGDDYFYSKELSYVRGKIADKVKVTVHIPITDSLQQFLDKYGTEPEKGRRVFPQILLNATTEAEMESRTHDFNRQIRKGMQCVCAKLGIRPVTASTARNSYITTLTWHGISDAFIDSMVGHVDSKNVLRGYQGTISPKKRLKVNNLLFVDPEIDEDE
ncbi:MAG: phage integrase SAM-like domain-containing protein, partial [Bacteroidales bacterium]|nr:phage integrase SAM-like domain-containing protein [Bacteroidales bacterium]